MNGSPQTYRALGKPPAYQNEQPKKYRGIDSTVNILGRMTDSFSQGNQKKKPVLRDVVDDTQSEVTS